MPENSKDLQTSLSVEITKEGHVFKLPGNAVTSLQELFSQLEDLVQQHDRVVVTVDVEQPKATKKLEVSPAPSSELAVISKDLSEQHLGSELIASIYAQLEKLDARIEAAHLFVMINDWDTGRRLWDDFLPQIKRPLVELMFLQDLRGLNFDEIILDDISLSRHLDQLGLIQAGIELCLVCENDLLHLSNAFELGVKPWLQQLGHYLIVLEHQEGL